LLTVFGFTPGGSSTVHVYTQTIQRTTQLIWEECGPCPVFASYTLAFALQLRKRHGKTSVRVAEECQLARSIKAEWHDMCFMYLPDMLVPFDKSTFLHIQDVWLQVIGAMFVSF